MAPRLMTYRELLEAIDRNRTPGRATRLVAGSGTPRRRGGPA